MSTPDIQTLVPQLDSLWSEFKRSDNPSVRRMAASELIKLLAEWESQQPFGLEGEFRRVLFWLNASNATLKCLDLISSGLDVKKEKLHEDIRNLKNSLPRAREKVEELQKDIESEGQKFEALRAEFSATQGEAEQCHQKLRNVATQISELIELKNRLIELQNLEQDIEAMVVSICDGDNPTPVMHGLVRIQAVQGDIVKYYRTWHSESERIAASLSKLEQGAVNFGDVVSTLQGLHDTLNAIDAKFKVVVEDQVRNDNKVATRVG